MSQQNGEQNMKTSQDNLMECFFNSPAFFKFKIPIYNHIAIKLKSKADYYGKIKRREAKFILGLCYNIPKKLQNRFLEDMQQQKLLKIKNQKEIMVLI